MSVLLDEFAVKESARAVISLMGDLVSPEGESIVLKVLSKAMLIISLYDMIPAWLWSLLSVYPRIREVRDAVSSMVDVVREMKGVLLSFAEHERALRLLKEGVDYEG